MAAAGPHGTSHNGTSHKGRPILAQDGGGDRGQSEQLRSIAMSEGLRIYNLFPTLAGTTRKWAAHLPRIAAMGFNAVYVNPFHYPGFSGSLYAVKDYYRLNPRFRGGEPGDDDHLLCAFAEAARAHGLRVIMDLGPNQSP